MPEQGDLLICGTTYDSNDMTFREEREVREIVRQQAGSESVDFDEVPLGDILPAICFVLRKRDDPEFTIDQAMDLKQRDVLIDREEDGKAPPTRRGGSSKK